MLCRCPASGYVRQGRKWEECPIVPRARGGGSFFTRATAVLAAAFFINSILLSSPLVRDVQDSSASVAGTAPVEATEEVVEEKVDVETIDLPPADLPDVETPTEDAALDVPDVPEQETGAEQADAEKSDSTK